MDKNTGKLLSGIDHLKQSIKDILSTPIGSRVMKRDYGSKIFELIDQPVNDNLKVSLFAATYEALETWEKRFKLKKIDIEKIERNLLILSLSGIYEENLVTLTVDINN